MSTAEPAQYFSRNTAFYSTEKLNALEPADLQAYTIDLHHLACETQENSCPESCNSERLCYNSIYRIKILKEVIQILIEKNSPLDEEAVNYIWDPKYGDKPAVAFDKIKARFLHPAEPA